MARGFQSMASFTCGVVLLSLVTQAASAGFAFYSRPQPFTSVPFGDNVIFNCTTNGTNITTTLKKEFSGKFVSLPHPSVNIKFVRKGDVFTIIDFGIPDSGSYKCYASDVNGNSIEYSVFLIPNMKRLPKMSINPHYLVTKTEGESTNFTCESASKTTLTWYKMVGQSDIPVPADKIATINAVTKKQVILMIKNAQISDSGDYKCILTFAKKEKYEMTSLRILKIIPAQIESASPKVVTGVRQEVLLSCILKAYPRPPIRWFKGDKEIKANLCDLDEKLPAQCGTPDMQYRSELKTLVKYEKYNATLIITKTSYPSDQGIYHCKAGEKDKIVSADVYVDIQVKPSINKKTSTKMVSSNVPAKVSCSVGDTNPTPTWSWEFQKRVCIKGADSCNPSDSSWKPLPKNHQVVPSLKTPANTSLINIPKEQKDAFYRCTATNILSSDNFTKIFLRNDNIDSIKIKDSKVPQVYTAGVDTIRIECDVLKQFSPIGVLWYKDGKLISPLDDNRISIEKTNASLDESYIRHVFTISNTTANDTGTYMCKLVMDMNKKDSIQVTVIARVAPNITGLVSQHVKMEVTQFVELRCDTLDANPQATITWYFRKSKDSKENNKIMGISTDLDNTKGCQSRRSGYYFLRDQKGAPLIICNPKHPKHTGWYQCVAENIEGSDRKDANVNVLAAASIIQAPTNRVIKTTLGTPLNITCVASGNPVPDVIWTKSGNRKVLVMGKGMARLQFVELLEKNLGNYTCNATNYKSSVLVFSISETSNDIMAQTNKAISQQALIGIICGCIAFVLIVSIICLAVYRRQKKQIEEYKELYFLRTGNSDYKIDPDRSLLDQCNDLPYDLDWEFPEERLILGKPLGAGAFGQVVRAEAIGMPAFKPRDKTPDAVKNRSKLRRSMRESKKKNEYSSMRLSKTTVAVKTLKEGASQSDYKDLASELKILIHLGNHKNIVNILGACTRGRRLMVIIEFAPHGDLLSFLRGKRDIYEPNWVKTSNNPEQEFTLVDLGMAAYQISRGMEFLASRKCVHRDLAARNVLVGHDYVMKISDFGLARDIYQDDLYVKTTSGLLPVKWMAMESLFDRVYTEKSDVWSFGIVLWETFTLGGNPYPGLPTEQLLDYLSEGQRMKQPQNCPLEMYAIMRDCWMQFPDQRPEFVAIAERLGKILEKNVSEDNPYIHLEMDEQTGQTDYYLNPCDAFNTQGRQTVDGYEEALPTPRPDTSNKYDTPLPTLPPPDSPGYEGPSEPLPSIPPTYEQATMGRQKDDHRNPSQSSNESGIGIDEKEKDRGEREPLMVHLEDETNFSPDKKGKSRTNESTV